MLNCQHVICATLMVSWSDEHGHVICNMLSTYFVMVMVLKLSYVLCCDMECVDIGHADLCDCPLVSKDHSPLCSLLSGKVVSTLCSNLLRSADILHE